MQQPILKPIVLTNISISNFVQYVLQSHKSPTTLIICGTRQHFLAQLVEEIRHISETNHTHSVAPEDNSSANPEQTTLKVCLHPMTIGV